MRRLKTKLEKSLPKLVHPSWCYESCSGHGRCWQLPKRQEFCECEPGFSGLFCDNEITFNYWWFWLSIGISLSILLLLPVLWCYGQVSEQRTMRRLKELSISTTSSSCSPTSTLTTLSSESEISTKSTNLLLPV